MDLESGVPGLDRLLGGGIPRRQSIVVTGQPGSGKTICCSQIAFSFAKQGLPVIAATVTSESHDKLVESLSGFGFFDRAAVGEELFFVSAYPWLKKGARVARDLLLTMVRERGARLLFIDGMRSIRDLWQDESMLREFLYDLNVGLAAADCVGLMSTEYPLATLLELPEATTVDGVIALSTMRTGARSVRRIEVAKLRGRSHVAGQHLAVIGDSGVTVIPRLEAVVSADGGPPPPSSRSTFGLQELDDLLNGGLPAPSTTLIAGSTGVGKTLLSATWLAQGGALGEPGLLVSFFEPAAGLADRARRVGVDLNRYLSDGTVEVWYRPPLEWEVDSIISQTLRHVRERGIKRLVIDGIAGLQQTLIDRDRTDPLLTALIVELRGLGVTTLFTKEVAKVAGPEIDFSDTPVTIATENFLFLRFVELRGRLHRILSVLKMRDSSYDGDVREFAVSETGLKVLAPLHSAEGLLTGLARPIGTSLTPEGIRP